MRLSTDVTLLQKAIKEFYFYSNIDFTKISSTITVSTLIRLIRDFS